MCCAPQDESSDSTRISSKRQCNRKSQLSDAMRARLGPQAPGKDKPRTTTTQEAYPSPSVAPITQNCPPHQSLQQVKGEVASRGPPGSIGRQLDDMFSTSFSSSIINCEPPRGFLVPKFFACDGSSDPFDHIMHYRQLMTLDIGNNALLCKVFPTSLQGQALSWFHHLSMNSIDNFKDLSKAFVGQYLCLALHKQNISTLQNIKMQDNESLREFVKQFGQAVLQVESYSMDTVLQIFKQSICPDTLFFESLAKKPPCDHGRSIQAGEKIFYVRRRCPRSNTTDLGCWPVGQKRRDQESQSHEPTKATK